MFLCPHFPAPSCSGNGQVDDQGTGCVCDEFWSGDKCETGNDRGNVRGNHACNQGKRGSHWRAIMPVTRETGDHIGG